MTTQPLEPEGFLENRVNSSYPQDLAESVATINDDDDDLSAFNVFDDLRTLNLGSVSWTVLDKVYPLLNPFGRPTVILPSSSYFAIGTSKGMIPIFNNKQFFQLVLVPGTTCPISKVQFLCASVDGTHISASLESGDVLIWDLNNDAQKDTTNDKRTREILPIIHISEHRSRKIAALGFLSERHTAVIVSELSGKVSCHSAFRNHLWQLTYKTSELATAQTSNNNCLSTAIYPGSPTLLFSDLQPLAIISESSLSLISSTNSTLCFHEEMNKSLACHLEACWSPCGTKVSFIRDNILTIVYLGRSASEYRLEVQNRVKWSSEENLQCIKWLNKDSVGLLTESKKLVLLDVRQDLTVFETIDLLPFNVLNPCITNLACFSQKVVVLTIYNLQMGEVLSWSDIVLQFVQKGAYTSALKSLIFFLRGEGFPPSLFRLHTGYVARKQQMAQPLKNLSMASVRHLLHTGNADTTREVQLYELLSVILSTFSLVFDDDQEVGLFLERAFEQIPDDASIIFLEVLCKMMHQNRIKSLTPTISSELLRYTAGLDDPKYMSGIVMKLDPQYLDINLAIRLCQKFDLVKEMIYLWNKASRDYLTPLVDLIFILTKRSTDCQLILSDADTAGPLIFEYVTFIMTGRQYPTNRVFSPFYSHDLKLQFCYLLFNGAVIAWPLGSSNRLHTRNDHSDEPAFPYIEMLLRYNCAKCLAMLHEIIEDPFFDDDDACNSSLACNEPSFRLRISRQFLIDLLLDKVKTDDALEQRIPIAIFIVRNVPKYPQFVRLSDHDILTLVSLLCSDYPSVWDYDAHKSLEALFATFHTPHVMDFVPSLKKKNFDRALFLIYRHLGAYSRLLNLILTSKELSPPTYSRIIVMEECLRETKHDDLKRELVVQVIKDNFTAFVDSNPLAAITIFESYALDLHGEIYKVDNEDLQRCYLKTLFEEAPSNHSLDIDLFCFYVSLMCKCTQSVDLYEMLERVELSLTDLGKVLKILQGHHNIYGSIIVQRRMKDFRGVIENIISYFSKYSMGGDENDRMAELQKFLSIAIETCIAARGEERIACCVDLLVFFLSYSGKMEGNTHFVYKDAVQEVFEKLSTLMEHGEGEKQNSLIGNILLRALETQDLILTKVQKLEPLMLGLLQSSNINEHILFEVLKITDSSSLSITDEYISTLQSGWSVKTNECEVCGKKVWGMGISTDIFSLWRLASAKSPSKIDSEVLDKCSIIAFSCFHAFHIRCLKNLGQSEGSYKCLVCG